MDINDILAREQVEHARARAALAPGARASHQRLADRYRAMIDAYRRGNGAAGRLAAPAPRAA